MKVKFNLKFLTTLVITLVALFIFNINSVKASSEEIVNFKDDNLKKVLVRDYDINKDGELSKEEMKKIEELSLEFMRINDITGLEYAVNLKILYLNNNIITDIQPLSNLTNLEELFLSQTNVSDIQALSNLTHLKQLSLKTTEIVDIQVLSKLINLTYLDLSYNGIENIQILSNLTNLEALYLRDNEIIDIQVLSNLTKLKKLDLQSNNIVNIQDLSNLINLEMLDLADNEITDIKVLSNLIKLDELDLAYNKIADIRVLSNLIKLNKLDLSFNKIVSIDDLSKLTNLTMLMLKKNKITDIQVLSRLKELKTIDLRDNEIIDIQALSNFEELAILYLDRNFIRDFSPLEDVKVSWLTIDGQLDKLVDSTTNIKMIFEQNVLPEDTSLTIKSIQNSTINTSFYWNNLQAFDITLMSNDKIVQPNGKVKISIPIPSNFDKSKLAIYRITPEGEEVKYNIIVEGDFVIIETDHFSTYILAEIKEVTQEQTENKISANTTIQQYIDNLTQKGTITVYNTDNNEEKDYSKLIKTGMKVKITTEEKEIVQTVVVKGDANGNGKIDSGDLTILRGVLYERKTIDEVVNKALDLEDNNKISTKSLTKIRNILYEGGSIE